MDTKKYIYKNKLSAQVACWLSRCKSRYFIKEVECRKNLDIFDYKNIGQPLPKYYTEICTDNNCFGIGYSIRKYADYKKSYINGWIEHGYFYADAISDLAAISFAKSIITFGNHREIINNRLLPYKRCIKIGPYIHYAEDYIDTDAFSKLKKSLGRVLLVFPVHSGTGEKVVYEKKDLLKKVESIACDFDTVLFSLFWSDITSDYIQEIEKMGYRIVCSGHRFDPNFLSRQKTIIQLADVTMSNGLGTNLVYCTYLKKPHWLFNQESRTVSLNSIGDKHIEYQKKNKDNVKIESLLYRAFGDYSNILSEEQYKLCKDLFGFDDIKSSEEMKEILISLE